MRTALVIASVVLLVVLLTVMTQIGGLVLLALIPFMLWARAWQKSRWKRILTNTFVFIAGYLIATFLIVPPVAARFGRVQLPMFETGYLKPANIITCILNRNYVKPALRDVVFAVAGKMHERYPGTVVNYLDANFPFIERFPLFPHLSHNDGKKLDLSFQYSDRNSGAMSTDVPSVVGYGVCEEPLTNERNTPQECKDKGFWQYSILQSIVPQRHELKLDERRTGFLIEEFAADKKIQMIFVEPHLAARMNVRKKIRFHGCHSVRHDDHIHVQIR